MANKRDIKLDIIRFFSLLCVISVHFLLNSGFYEETVEGKKMLIMCIYRMFFIICVPMFITLTGYLKNQEQLSTKYFKKVSKVLIIYFICSVIYSVFTKFYLHQEMTIEIFIRNILSYKGTRYSWYIEMYLGLFLLTPFLNLIFNNLKSQKDAKILLLVLFVMIGLCGIVNIYNFESTEWWKRPSSNNDYFQIIPKWWGSIYPIFYYFLGAYLRKYSLNISKENNILLIILTVTLFGTFDYYRSYKSIYVWGIWNDYGSGFVMIITALVFNYLLHIKIKETNLLRNILKYISNACLGGYLISCMFDQIYYQKLNGLVPIVKDRFIYAPLIILISLFSSIALSLLISIIYNFFSKFMLYLNKKI